MGIAAALAAAFCFGCAVGHQLGHKGDRRKTESNKTTLAKASQSAAGETRELTVTPRASRQRMRRWYGPF
jgi:hypothetical protein